MSEFFEINEFFVEGQKKSKSHVLLHIAEPTNPQERKKGYFFALIEINNSYPEQIMNLQEIIDEIEEEYYSPEKEQKDILIEILEKVNQKSDKVMDYKNSKLHCLVGTINGSNNQLTLAYCGNPIAILFYKEKAGEMEIKNIIESENEDNESEKENLLFSSLMEGVINPGDHMMFTTPGVKKYFNGDRIGKILKTRNARLVAEHMQKVLSNSQDELSFGGIFFHFPTKYSDTKSGQLAEKTESSQQSLDRLLAATKKTEETLSPPFFGNLSEKIKQTNRGQKKEQNQIGIRKNLSIQDKIRAETNFRPSDPNSEEKPINKILISTGKSIFYILAGIIFVFKKILFIIYKIIIGIMYFITNRAGSRNKMLAQTNFFIKQKIKNYRNMTFLSKIIFFITILLGMLFIISIFYIRIREKRETLIIEYQNTIKIINERKNEAESKIIYGHDEEALNLIKEAENLILGLTENENSTVDKENLKKEMEIIKEKLRKITIVESEMIVNLKTEQPQANAKRIDWLEDKIFATGPDEQSIYIVDPVTAAVETLQHNSIPNLIIATTPKEQDKISFLDTENRLAEYIKEEKKLSSRTIDFPNKDTKISAIFTYNRKLYSVDINNNKIYKHNQTQTGYDKGAEWLKEEITLDQTISIAIDGDIFALQKNGSILKFNNGNQEKFEISGLEPQLENPIQIWTYNGVPNIYILEPTNKRVITIDKNGKFIAQYTDKNWQNPTGMLIDEKNQVIYILDNNKIYKFKTD